MDAGPPKSDGSVQDAGNPACFPVPAEDATCKTIHGTANAHGWNCTSGSPDPVDNCVVLFAPSTFCCP